MSTLQPAAWPAAAGPSDRPIDLLAVGLLFFDVVLSDLPHAPVPGREMWTSSVGSGPGGIANFAIAAARLGLRTGVAAAIGDDSFGDLCRARLDAEGVDLSASRVLAGWSTPVTASLGYAGDRAMVTGGTPCPLTPDDVVGDSVPAARIAIAHLEPGSEVWTAAAAAAGMRVFGDLGWDATGSWDSAMLSRLDHCFGFFPNEEEAQGYTRTADARSAAVALAERVQVAVVTRGARGVIAVDAGTGEEVDRPALPVRAVDPTGAGDVFGAALAVAYLQPGWTLAQRVDLAVLVAGLTVSRPGGAAGAPTLSELITWIRSHPPGSAEAARFAHIPSLAAGP